MDARDLQQLLNDVASGAVAPDHAVAQLRSLPFADIGVARIDHHRSLRQGLPEAVFGPGKTAEAVAAVITELLTNGQGPVVLTRADKAQRSAALAVDATGTVINQTVVWRPAAARPEKVVVATAGTADLEVADECAALLWAHGVEALRLTDIGVSGLHRVLSELESLQNADAVVVIAGMEGALASVIGGLTSAPVVAVPTSVGYGASLEGVTALLGMLASCASGITVTGIDNGFGAGCAVMRQLGSAT
ncbi:MAG: nickel pincer cofactor biosynthesis protein LarB [Actinobacteria bacterium]|nr:nickel pincer cofactor biosynthesis protein LarB [Actinomycetota bacterium]